MSFLSHTLDNSCQLQHLDKRVRRDEVVHLVGYSYGAIVAFEMARMLRAQDRQCRLIMIDNSIDAVRIYEAIYRKQYKLEVSTRAVD